jgi:hypothetical protein
VSNVKKIIHGFPLCQNNVNGVYIVRSFKFILKVGVKESIVDALLIRDHRSGVYSYIGNSNSSHSDDNSRLTTAIGVGIYLRKICARHCPDSNVSFVKAIFQENFQTIKNSHLELLCNSSL